MRFAIRPLSAASKRRDSSSAMRLKGSRFKLLPNQASQAMKSKPAIRARA